MSQLSLVDRAAAAGDRTAFRGTEQRCTYAELLQSSSAVAAVLLDGAADLDEARVAYLVPPGPQHAAAQWGIWRAGGVAVPLSMSAAERELDYALTDSQASVVVTTGAVAKKVAGLCRNHDLRLLRVDDTPPADERPLPDLAPDRRAMILYTSGTTSTPKGVVTTHACIEAQIESLVEAWGWRDNDRIPLFLPLHHIHGIINVMSSALWAGAQIEAFPRFDAKAILHRVAAGGYTVFMAVPTVYVKLIAEVQSLPDDLRRTVLQGFGEMRLMVSGSAALPAGVHRQWTELTGQRLLERYGMTEVGMALSNPYEGERRPGAVGRPLPGVEVRLVSEQGEAVAEQGVAGEIQVRGATVFREYWERPEATSESFVDGWFRTGDMAVIEDGYYRILGRRSVDIIKSGGYKLSALEIEAVLLDHPAIAECAVVGLPDETWGETVAAAVVLAEGESLQLEELRSWLRDRLSDYKAPRRLLTVEQLPRNAMGKVTKSEVAELFA